MEEKISCYNLWGLKKQVSFITTRIGTVKSENNFTNSFQNFALRLINFPMHLQYSQLKASPYPNTTSPKITGSKTW